MIFKADSIGLILEGKKTQTRRPVKDGELAGVLEMVPVVLANGHTMLMPCSTPTKPVPGLKLNMQHESVDAVRGPRQRVKWVLGRTYAICPGRGKKAVGRILITEIRCERVMDISDRDVPAEGLRWDFERGRWVYGKTVLENEDGYPAQNIAAYLHLWRSLYPKSDCTELCWVLTFEPVKP